MIKKLDFKIKPSRNTGIFHDTRADAKNLMEVCNRLIDKVNELTEEVNRMNLEKKK